ncbi:MAG: hypothetical protein OJF50_001273 [Nitrospira sp.]|nr:hypothetical protein [Nitrospira sp.]
MNAVEHDEAAQKDGKEVVKNTKDPVFELMRDTLITNEQYLAVSSQTGENRIESADAILIINSRKEYEWNRYLKAVLRLPDWIDLGLENRTRFESYDHS